MNSHKQDVRSVDRLAFVKNWVRFRDSRADQRLVEAQTALTTHWQRDSLADLRLLQFDSCSLAARRMSARAPAFNDGPRSVAVTRQLAELSDANSEDWIVDEAWWLDREGSCGASPHRHLASGGWPLALGYTARPAGGQALRNLPALHPDARDPFVAWRRRSVGGLPFKVPKPEPEFDCVVARGFQLRKLVTCGGGLGCNGYVFRRDASGG